MKFGPYELGELISADGTAEVHSASCTRDDAPSQVALTRFDATLGADREFVQFFEVEARFALELDHPNIARTYDFGSVGGVCYCAWELIQGIDIASLLGRARARGSQLPLGMAVQICLAVAEALAYAHDLEDEAVSASLHGSITPRNIYLSFDGEVRLADYGLAQTKGYAAERMERWQISDCGYMAPEQIAGEVADSRSDLFSLGAVLHEMMTGQPLFIADTLEETLRHVLEKEVSSPSRANPEVHSSLDTIVKKALNRDMTVRFQTGDEFCDELFAFAHSDSTMVMPRDLARWVDELAAGGGLEWPEAVPLAVTQPRRGDARRSAGRRNRRAEGQRKQHSARPAFAAARVAHAADGGSPNAASMLGADDDQSTTMKRPKSAHPSFSDAFECSTVRDTKMAERPVREDSRVSRVADCGPIDPLGQDSLEMARYPDGDRPAEPMSLEGPLQGEPTTVDFGLPAAMLADAEDASEAIEEEVTTNAAGGPLSYSPVAITNTRYPSGSHELDQPPDGDLESDPALTAPQQQEQAPEELPPVEEASPQEAATTQKRSSSANKTTESDSLRLWRWVGMVLVLVMLIAGGVGAYFLAKRKRAAKRRARPTELVAPPGPSSPSK